MSFNSSGLDLNSQIKMLQNVEADTSLINRIPPVIAIGFGVIPLEADVDRISFACFPHINPDVPTTLSKVLSLEVRCHPFAEVLMFAFLRRIYMRDRKSVNFNTFLDQNFLRDPKNLSMLASEKDDAVVGQPVDLPPNDVAFVDASYVSELRNLDAAQRHLLILPAEIDYAFGLSDDYPVVYERGVLSQESKVLLRKSFRLDGDESGHGFSSVEIRAFPYFIHPSEIQIAGIETDGTLIVYIYDHLEKVRPSESRRWQFEYYFLSYGHRYWRRLTFAIHQLRVFKREQIRYSPSPAKWEIEDFKRWLWG